VCEKTWPVERPLEVGIVDATVSNGHIQAIGMNEHLSFELRWLIGIVARNGHVD